MAVQQQQQQRRRRTYWVRRDYIRWVRRCWVAVPSHMKTVEGAHANDYVTVPVHTVECYAVQIQPEGVHARHRSRHGPTPPVWGPARKVLAATRSCACSFKACMQGTTVLVKVLTDVVAAVLTRCLYPRHTSVGCQGSHSSLIHLS